MCSVCSNVQDWVTSLQVLFGSLSLQLAEAEPDSIKTSATLAAAHKVLSQALAHQGRSSQKDTAVICMLLARVELLGNLRRKQERAEAHTMQVCQSSCSVIQHSWHLQV